MQKFRAVRIDIACQIPSRSDLDHLQRMLVGATIPVSKSAAL
jgi:hypothetical protein